jgi:hypothetical protein
LCTKHSDRICFAFSTARYDDQVDALGLIGQLLDKMIPARRLGPPEKPKAHPERANFMASLFETLLMSRHQLGEGELHRTLRDLQRRFFRPPTTEEVAHRAPWHEGGTGQRFK